MTKEDLTRLDNYGHKELKSLDEIHLNEYATLLEIRRKEVLERVLELRVPGRGFESHPRYQKEVNMPYDKYRNWGPDLPSHEGIKKQVLKDLETSTDDIDRLEILDSFEVYVERAHTAELAEHLSNQILIFAQPFLTAAIQGTLPSSTPLSRPRRAPAPVEIKEEESWK